jgi:hypothetical protein
MALSSMKSGVGRRVDSLLSGSLEEDVESRGKIIFALSNFTLCNTF